jgi:signal transduction histidine kinase
MFRRSPGHPTDVRASASRTVPSYLLVELSDTGCGIMPGLLERVFENHYQVTESSQDGRTASGWSCTLPKTW